tara:strand:- start:1007 stop:3040 length:2034 start_codon:yes stop_codon:yes gene_type:complete
MSKTVAFVDSFDEVELFLKTFKSSIDENTIFIAGDALALEALKSRGIQCKALDDYRNRKEYKEAETYGLDLAEKWFIDYEGTDFTVFEGISLGRCMKREVVTYFFYLLKAILDVSNILKYENPGKVLLVNDYSNDFSISTKLFGRDGLYLHNKIFQFLKKDKKYDVEICGEKIYKTSFKPRNIISKFCLKKQNLQGWNIFFYCPSILNRFIKKIVIIIVDQAKRAFVRNDKFGLVRALTLSATDLTHFGSALVKSYSRKRNCLLYYFDAEDNCYFNFRLIRVSIRKSTSLIENKKISKYMSDLKLRFEKIKNSEKTSPVWIFRNISLLNFFENYLDEVIENKIPDLINFLLASEDVIQRKKINIVLISERWGAKRVILAQIAKRNGLSVLHIPHSIEPGKHGDKIDFIPFTDIKVFPFYPTHEVSGLQCHLRLQESRGICHNKLFLTGIPRFGNIEKKTQKDFDEARKRLNFSLDEEIVLFVIRPIIKPLYDKGIRGTQESTFTLSYLYESFIKQLLERKNSRAVFKLKMFDNGTNCLINSLITKNESNNVSFFKNHLIDLLIASDAVVVTHSNIGIEAIYHDTPVIVLNDPEKPSTLPLCQERAAIEIKRPEELLPVLNRLREDKSYREQMLINQRNFLQRNLPPGNFSAAERTTDVILQLANNITQGYQRTSQIK